MHRIIISALLALQLCACSSLAQGPRREFFVLFFDPETMHLSPEASEIVQQAAFNARYAVVSRVEVSVPRDAPGGVPLVEGRITAIQNILSASGVDPRRIAHGSLSTADAAIPGAADRAEIKLIR